ncbi:MAG: hypothetical protein V4649_15495 [Bacteroidota bacterium]
MKTIQLHIPDELADKVQAEKKLVTLAEEYRRASEENTELAADFIHVDLEGWDDEEPKLHATLK